MGKFLPNATSVNPEKFWLFHLVFYSKHASEELREFSYSERILYTCVCAVVGVKRRRVTFHLLRK